MSDLYKDIYGKNAPYHKVCRVAYTLDNDQPVVCTHIGDQPLFFFEYEEDAEMDDDEFYDMADYDTIARELAALKSEIEGFEKGAKYFSTLAMTRQQEFTENVLSLSSGVDLPITETKARLEELRNLISQSRTGAAYLERADEHKIEIVLSVQIEKSSYDKRTGKIFINAALGLSDQVLLLARELRRHWQHREGALINPLTFMPEHAILVHRTQNADLIVSVIRVAWELQLAGRHDIWARIENSQLADLGRAYAREAFMDFRTINNGIASTSVFEAWFLSERCRQYDKKIIQAMLADYKGYVFENTQASKSVTADLIAALGSVPYGKNYLAQHAATIMSDPVFTEVRDRSNANFLWFIKFERSFKETEQELQNGNDLSTRDIRHEVFTKSQSPSHDQKHTAQIVQLFDGGADQRAVSGGKLSSNNKSSKRSKKGADIIDMRAWSGRP